MSSTEIKGKYLKMIRRGHENLQMFRLFPKSF